MFLTSNKNFPIPAMDPIESEVLAKKIDLTVLPTHTMIVMRVSGGIN